MKFTEAQLAHLILAFHEGTLSTDEKQQLENLILAHPEISEDLEQHPILSISNETYNGPSLVQSPLENLAVYQSEEGHPYDKLAIGSLEGLLSKEEDIIERQLMHDEVYPDFKKRVQQTQLIPDISIVYPFQYQLLKESPLRVFFFKKYVYPITAAAAILIAVILVSRNTSGPTDLKPIQKGVASKKSVIQQSNAKNSDTTLKPILSKNSDQSATHQQQEVPLEPGRDGILPFQEQAITPDSYAQNGIENSPNQDIIALNPTAEQIWINTEPQAQNNSSVFTKEPITVKAFLLQKTNEKLFGTASPSTDMRYETMARYASETIGLPVRYAVQEGSSRDKVVFQLGPISIERTRSKK
jgi:hypothetical protein